MKKLLWLLLILGNIAFADAVLDQQYVTAVTARPQLQSPFQTSQNSDSQQPSQIQSQQAIQQPPNNPTAIYTSPTQTQQMLQVQQATSQYAQQQPVYQYQQAPQGYPQQGYAQQTPQQWQQQPAQYMQPNMQQEPQWQTRPQAQSQEGMQPNYQNQPAPQGSWQNNPAYPSQQPTINNQQPSYPNAYPAPQQPYQQPSQQPYTQQPAQNYQQTQLPTNYPSNLPAQMPTQVPPALNNSGAYNSEAEQTWFSNCLKAVTSKTMTPYANAFCQCGWQKITAGGLNPNLLTSQNPADIQKANMMLQGISQECLAQVLKGQGSK